MNKAQEDELLQAMRSLLSDIESMEMKNNPNWFGRFSEFEDSMDGASIEWPNLAISTQALKDVLAKIEKQRRNDNPPYWHQHNPWKDELVYVPIEELAECALSLGYAGRTVKKVLEQWSHYGIWLDAYILPEPGFTAGIRFGPEDDQYLSPGFHDHMLINLLYKHGGTGI